MGKQRKNFIGHSFFILNKQHEVKVIDTSGLKKKTDWQGQHVLKTNYSEIHIGKTIEFMTTLLHEFCHAVICCHGFRDKILPLILEEYICELVSLKLNAEFTFHKRPADYTFKANDNTTVAYLEEALESCINKVLLGDYYEHFLMLKNMHISESSELENLSGLGEHIRWNILSAIIEELNDNFIIKPRKCRYEKWVEKNEKLAKKKSLKKSKKKSKKRTK